MMKRHILVVDDEIGALTLIGIMLERGGFDVLKARDAQAALVVLEETVPDLIILDVMMPGMNGIELCQVIRQRPLTSKTPVLILSARGDAESIIKGIEAGANDYLPKPILHHDLVSKVRSMLGQDMAEA
ncbi:MAG: response regulator [Anaerolineae bacterium]|nr:response regulator [Anaerolineae bacterium]